MDKVDLPEPESPLMAIKLHFDKISLYDIGIMQYNMLCDDK
jgi:hypothetical protein